jgi:arylsulfatase
MPLHLAILATLFLPAGFTAAAPAETRPNIIVILTDDQGYGDAGCTGNPVLKTPNIDRLHREGVRFSDFHVSPTCAPTRSAMLSGKHEFRNGVTHTILERERMSLKTTTIAQVLKSAGYTTGIFGKWHLGDEDAYQPGKRGFDEVFIHGGGGIGQSYPGSCGDAPGNRYFDPVIKHNGRFTRTNGYCTDVFFNQAIRWMESVKDREPFLCYLPTNAPHGPLQVRPEDEARYKDKVAPDTAKFFGMIANIDDNVGRLLAKLSEWKIDRRTLVIFMNDNGGTGGTGIFNAGMRGKKGTPHNGGSRALSLWRWPDTLTPATCDRLAAHIDIFPTLCELAGAAIPDNLNLEGHSLVPLLKDPQAGWHDDRMLFTHVGRWGGMKPGAPPEKYGPCSIRWRNFLQVRNGEKWSLYDLKADPGEKSDIAGKSPETVATLNAAYDAWWTGVLPCLENETAWKSAPAINPFHEQYQKQFGDAPRRQVPANRRKSGKTAPSR